MVDPRRTVGRIPDIEAHHAVIARSQASESAALDEIAFTEVRWAIIAGIVAGSIALIGFGLDSAIEGFASVVIVWRFTGRRTLSHEAEDRAQKLVAIQFFILAPLGRV